MKLAFDRGDDPMRDRSHTQPTHDTFGEDDFPTKPDARPIPPYRSVQPIPAPRARASEPEEEESEEEEDFDEFDDAAAIRETRAGALATSAWDRTPGSSAFEDEVEDALADTERHPMFSDLEAPTDVDLEPFDEPEDRG
jgi:hypothetical protein